ncbi:unnamed protein product [Prorocentrum cordatum]|uniref:Uncharacterized protein n=1 Tax=Prorocentrum cordatum TaxID=2364126 RepID=A0ABN9PDR3_9DINO|nr:unnamed protein product [Polarella glacialis]
MVKAKIIKVPREDESSSRLLSMKKKLKKTLESPVDETDDEEMTPGSSSQVLEEPIDFTFETMDQEDLSMLLSGELVFTKGHQAWRRFALKIIKFMTQVSINLAMAIAVPLGYQKKEIQEAANRKWLEEQRQARRMAKRVKDEMPYEPPTSHINLGSAQGSGGAAKTEPQPPPGLRSKAGPSALSAVKSHPPTRILKSDGALEIEVKASSAGGGTRKSGANSQIEGSDSGGRSAITRREFQSEMQNMMRNVNEAIQNDINQMAGAAWIIPEGAQNQDDFSG